MPMHTCISLDADDSWFARQDKLIRLATFPQPIYTLVGPGLYAEERLLLIRDVPWTPDAVQVTLAAIYDPADVEMDAYAQWMSHWMSTSLGASPDR